MGSCKRVRTTARVAARHVPGAAGGKAAKPHDNARSLAAPRGQTACEKGGDAPSGWVGTGRMKAGPPVARTLHVLLLSLLLVD